MLALLAITVVGATAAVQTGLAATPGNDAVLRIAVAMGANRSTGIVCMDLGGPNAAGNIVYGTAVRRTHAIGLNSRYTCKWLIDWQRTGVFGPRALYGLVVIGHEIAHTRGVRNEAQAECRGARAALTEMRRIGMSRLEMIRATKWLRERHDAFAPPAYRLAKLDCPY